MRTTVPAAPMTRGTREPAGRTYALHGQSATAPALAPGLHLVATPIGNLRDITLRALEVLAAADLIACEDTRVTRKLLDHYGITTPLTPYHDHNAAAARPKLLARLAEGGAVALVSDAGTPLVSDPGFKLVREARDAGHAVTALAGRFGRAGGADGRGPADRPLLLRRLPAREGGPAARPHRRARAHPGDAGAVRDRAAAGRRRSPTSPPGLERARPRSAASSPSCYEEVRRGDLATLARDYAGAAAPRGEIVIVIAPPDPQAATTEAADLDALLRQALERVSLKEAVGEIAAVTGRPRREVYQRALALDQGQRRWPMSARAPARCSAAARGRSVRSRSAPACRPRAGPRCC